MMEKKEAFEKIKIILPYIHEYFQTKEIPVGFDETKRSICAEIYTRFLVPGSIFPGFSCKSCYVTVFELIDSYYQREYPKHIQLINQQEQQKEANTANIKSSETTTSKKEIKSKYNGKNKK